MLVSRIEALAQNLLAQALLRERPALAHRGPGTNRPVLPSPVRRAVGAALICPGMRLGRLPRLEPSVESVASTPPT